ncbi:hypothetical protein VKT23_014519 [Stygiomarasmius scandens]|uniref:P-loop containing nucleoside triphosphate hydrolase protein n=1 Tax=Marasmiellus scandens TaxID=2682957 RepID=A0ABR1J3I6_9AGAR
MSSYFFHLQSIFPVLQNATQPANTNDAAASSTFADVVGEALPSELLSIFALLFSMASTTSLKDWLKLLLIGGFFESFRRLFSWTYTWVLEGFYMNANFDSNDSSYEWMMVWLSKQPGWAKTRDVEISTGTHGASNTALLLEDDDGSGLSQFESKTTRKLAYIPSPSRTYTLWYKGRPVWITRTRAKEARLSGGFDNFLQVSILTRDHKLLRQLLQDARRSFMVAQENNLSIWTADKMYSYGDWRRISSRPKRSLKSIILDPGVKDMLLDDARDFLASKEWYNERGIPFRRGYLLYGAPGSGKTSLIHSIAGELKLDVYIISISSKGLDDTTLNSLVNYLPERCVALMEDIDVAFPDARGLSKDDESEISARKGATETVETHHGNVHVSTPNMVPETGSRVTLSGLLNALDGIGAQEGRILFATTNKYASLDPALCRPGRMDLHIEFKLASKYQAKGLFQQFYHPTGKFDTDVDPKEYGKSETEHSDSGYSGSSTPEYKFVTSSNVPGLEPMSFEFSVEHIKYLSKKFSDAVPDRELSMASLQGYLMTYKMKPVDAVRNVGEWIRREKAPSLRKRNNERKTEGMLSN